MPPLFSVQSASLVAAIASICYSAYFRPSSILHPSHSVPRRAWSTQEGFVFELAKASEPVVLLGSDVEHWSARRQWSSAAKLAKLIAAHHGKLNGVYHQTQGTRFGPFYDPLRPFHVLESVQPRNPYTSNASLSKAEFRDAFVQLPSATLRRNDELVLPSKPRKEPNRTSKIHGSCWAYSGAVVDALGPSAEDALEPLDAFLALNPAQSSVNLWVGQPGATTPCHYDSYHNFYAQLAGRKRFVLFPPADAAHLHTYPFLHPSYAQCHARIPKLVPQRNVYWDLNGLWDLLASWIRQIRLAVPLYTNDEIYNDNIARTKEKLQPTGASPAWEVDLEPGEVLYIPPFWLHEATALNSKNSNASATDEDAPTHCGLENGPASVSVNVWTGASDSAAAETLFALPLPPALTDNKTANTSMNAANVVALVWVVLCRHFASEEKSNGHGGAAALLKRLANGRYAPLIETSELPLEQVGDGFCVGLSNQGTNRVLAAAGATEAYVARAVSRMAELSPLGRGRQSPWLQNWVEMVALQILPLEMVPSVIMGISECV